MLFLRCGLQHWDIGAYASEEFQVIVDPYIRDHWYCKSFNSKPIWWDRLRENLDTPDRSFIAEMEHDERVKAGGSHFAQL